MQRNVQTQTQQLASQDSTQGLGDPHLKGTGYRYDSNLIFSSFLDMFGSKKKKKAQEQKENAMLYRKAMEQEEQEEQKARLMELREKVNTFSLPLCVYFKTSPHPR